MTGQDSLEGEPQDGWVSGPELTDTELLVTTLCRFSGNPASHGEPCPTRSARLHPDVECRTLFFQAEALGRGVTGLEDYESVPEQLRQPWSGGAPIAIQNV